MRIDNRESSVADQNRSGQPRSYPMRPAETTPELNLSGVVAAVRVEGVSQCAGYGGSLGSESWLRAGDSGHSTSGDCEADWRAGAARSALGQVRLGLASAGPAGRPLARSMARFNTTSGFAKLALGHVDRAEAAWARVPPAFTATPRGPP